jgi:hypothetical protein
MGDLYPVLAGLQEGDRVVVHGAFAIDADLQIQGGDSMMNLPGEDDAAADEHAVHEHAKDDAATPEPGEAPPPKRKRAAPKKQESQAPRTPANQHQHHMQGHQH